MRLLYDRIHSMRQAMIGALMLVLAVSLAPAPLARAATFTVTKLEDTADGSCSLADCSLREAIIAANSSAGPDTIVLPAGIYYLKRPGANENAAQNGDLDVTGALTITGALSNTTIIDIEKRDRVFEVLGAKVTIANVTIRHGDAGTDAGGGIRNTGTLTLTASIVSDNSSNNAGGGIANAGTLIVSSSIISGNITSTSAASVGGGVLNSGVFTATNSLFFNNKAQGDGGGIYNANSPQSIVSLKRVTISGNAADSTHIHSGNGGGIANYGVVMVTNSILNGNTAESGGAVVSQGALNAVGSTLSGNTATFGGGITSSDLLTLTNSTISGNSALENGGGIATIGTVDLNNVTIATNTADSDSNGSGEGGGVRNINGTVNLRNTLLAGNTDRGGETPECVGTLTSQDYNLVLQPTGCTIVGSAAHNIVGQDPLLGPLQQNGGPTPTRALLQHSPAIDAGNPATPDSAGACAASDQRSVIRPQQARCDIGALEKVAPPVASLAFKPALIIPSGVSKLTMTISNASPTSPISGMMLNTTLAQGLSIATAPPASNSCGGKLTAQVGSRAITLTGGTLLQGGSCTIVVAVTSPTEGTYVANASPISATETGMAGQSSQATLRVQTPLFQFLPLAIKHS
jgi:CSLREA domain-containing protein